jgi:hypothetical protein
MGAITARRRHSALPLMTTTIQYNANAAAVTISPNGRFTLFNGQPDYRIVGVSFALSDVHRKRQPRPARFALQDEFLDQEISHSSFSHFFLICN